MNSSWFGWVQENIQRGCDPERILEILLENKFTVMEIQQAMGRMFPAQSPKIGVLPPQPMVVAAAAVAPTMPQAPQQPSQKRDSLVAIQRELAQLNPHNKTIERRWGVVSREEFLEQYYSANRPVILCGMMENWAAMSKWTPDYLKSVGGKEMVDIATEREGSPNYEADIGKHRRKIGFGAYVDIVTGGKETNYSLVARNEFFLQPGARSLLKDIQLFPEYLQPDFSGKGIHLGYGPKGTVTPLRHEEMNLLLAQVQGRKRIRLIPANELDLVYNHHAVYSSVDPENPDYIKFPKYRDATVLDFELTPGEVLFIPVGWWHHTHALETSISLSLTHFVYPNAYKWQHPQMQARMGTQPNAAAAFQSVLPIAQQNTVAKTNGMQATQQNLMPQAQQNDKVGTHPMLVKKDHIPATLDGVDYKALSEVRITRTKRPGLVRFDSPKLQLYLLDDFMTAKECDDLVKIIDRDLRPSTVTIDNGDKYFRTSRTSDLFPQKDKLVAQIDEKISSTLGIRLPYSEMMQAQKYEVGQEFKAHTDYFEPKTDEYLRFATDLGNRTWTFMVYLNNTTKGGGTRFTKLDQIFYPKKGQAVIWNSLYADGSVNRDTEHHGMIVEEGEKYVITKWFREKGKGPMFYEDKSGISLDSIRNG